MKILPPIFMERKWTDGKPYERSMRRKLALERETREFTKGVEESAHSSALNYDENTWHLLNQVIYDSPGVQSNVNRNYGN